MFNRIRLGILAIALAFTFGLGYHLGYSKLETYKEQINEETQQRVLELSKAKDNTIRLLLKSLADGSVTHANELDRLRTEVRNANERAKHASADSLRKQIERERELQLRGADLLTRLNKSFGACADQIEVIRTYNNINSQ